MPMADRKCRGMVLNREETGIFEEWAIQDEPREECGVFGMYDFSAQENVASTIYYGLLALQHRGQESCGIAVSSTSGPKGKVRSRKGMGLVNETFEEEDFDSLTGDIGVGHVRYSTAGASTIENAQPLVLHYIKGTLALAHNGNLVNSPELMRDLSRTGAIFQTTTDSELIAYEIARARINTGSVEEAVSKAMERLKGSYSLVIMSPRKLIGARDPFGFRPLCIGKRGKAWFLASESCALDTIVALVAGLIIIPSCFAFGQSPAQGPGLIFVTLSNVFAMMPAGRFCGAAFFLFMSFAALSTLIAVFENIVAFWMDLKGYKRRKVAFWNVIAVFLMSLPCALGFNVLSGFEPFGPGSCVLDLEDFIVSNTMLPAGAIFMVVFCNSRYGWGQEKFFDEMNAGEGLKLPRHTLIKIYFKWILPALITILLAQGYLSKFAPELAAKIF